jgi:hypothetical protein
MPKTTRTLIELQHMRAELGVMREDLASQGQTLEAIKNLLVDALSLRPIVTDHERRLHDLEGRRP